VEEELKVKAAEEAAAEAARVEWMKYYAEKGDYKRAMDLAVEDGDATYIEACKEAARVAKLDECKSRGAYTQAKKYATAAEAVDIDAEVEAKAEANRKEWIEYYTKTSDYDNALALCVSTEEEASMTEVFESMRVAHLKQQVELGKYAIAKQYAITEGELQMIEQSEEAKAEEARLAWLKHYTDTHDYRSAEQYVVTDAELAAVQQAKHEYLEKCRVTWRDHYTTVGDYDNAVKYVVSNAEAAELLVKFEGRRK
jgi:anti-sigma28 factor (negative regulator of flagellin synthesis)